MCFWVISHDRNMGYGCYAVYWHFYHRSRARRKIDSSLRQRRRRERQQKTSSPSWRTGDESQDVVRCAPLELQVDTVTRNYLLLPWPIVGVGGLEKTSLFLDNYHYFIGISSMHCIHDVVECSHHFPWYQPTTNVKQSTTGETRFLQGVVSFGDMDLTNINS